MDIIDYVFEIFPALVILYCLVNLLVTLVFHRQKDAEDISEEEQYEYEIDTLVFVGTILLTIFAYIIYHYVIRRYY